MGVWAAMPRLKLELELELELEVGLFPRHACSKTTGLAPGPYSAAMLAQKEARCAL